MNTPLPPAILDAWRAYRDAMASRLRLEQQRATFNRVEANLAQAYDEAHRLWRDRRRQYQALEDRFTSHDVAEADRPAYAEVEAAWRSLMLAINELRRARASLAHHRHKPDLVRFETADLGEAAALHDLQEMMADWLRAHPVTQTDLDAPVVFAEDAPPAPVYVM